jgi:hypothetical protein
VETAHERQTRTKVFGFSGRTMPLKFVAIPFLAFGLQPFSSLHPPADFLIFPLTPRANAAKYGAVNQLIAARRVALRRVEF